MKTRKELIDLLQPLLDTERQFLIDNDIPEGNATHADILQQVISALKEPDPKILSLFRAINTCSDKINSYQKTLHDMAAKINKARCQLISEANYNETIEDWVKNNIKGDGENAD